MPGWVTPQFDTAHSAGKAICILGVAQQQGCYGKMFSEMI